MPFGQRCSMNPCYVKSAWLNRSTASSSDRSFLKWFPGALFANSLSLSSVTCCWNSYPSLCLKVKVVWCTGRWFCLRTVLELTIR